MLDVFPLVENAHRMLGCKNVEFLDWPDGGFWLMKTMNCYVVVS